MLEGPVNDSRLSDMELRVLGLIRKGKATAVTGSTIANELGEPNDRRIRIGIRNLIKKGYPIASSTEGRMGYYLAVTYEEWRRYRASLHSRLVEDARRIGDFDRAFRAYQEHEEPVQLLLG